MILTIVFTQSSLEDLRFSGSKFTWTNRQCNSPILEKLDGVLVNIKLFLASEATFLYFGIFNHSSMLVKLASMPKRKTPFKFFYFWVDHSQFNPTIRGLGDRNVWYSYVYTV
jgi:hypothetical protein